MAFLNLRKIIDTTLSNIIRADFPFRYPIKLDIAIFGGMLTKICTWSGIKCPSSISTPL